MTIGDAYLSHGRTQDAMCTPETVRVVIQCAKDLLPLDRNGFPWGPVVMTDHELQNEIRNRQKQNGDLRDPLDRINYVCDVFGDFIRCLDQHAIKRECLLTGSYETFRVHTVFQFICNVQPRSSNLLHSLQCLKESRVLDLLVFYLADRPGTHTEDMAQGTVNAFFRFLNSAGLVFNYGIHPLLMGGVVSYGLICLPESVISQDISFIVDRKCGSYTADLVRDFYLYFRTRFNHLLNKIGFPTNICDKDPRITDRLYAAADNKESGGTLSRLFDQFLEENSPGTAMDTVYGHFLRSVIKTIPDREFCDPFGALIPSFRACFLLSYDPSGKARFNVMLYAHAVSPVPYAPFPDSSSLNIFGACWNILQQTCGANASYYDYKYRVSAGSRKIQRLMDNLTCEWQDTLIQKYIEASEHGNIWPTGMNAPARPMCLSRGYITFGSLANSMSDLLSVVNRGVKEIASRCSMASAKRIIEFYDRLKYGWYNQIKLIYILQG